jgi:hypothetical protein
MNEIKEMIARLNKLLPVGTSISYTEAERRAGEFLYGLALIADYKHEVGAEKIKNLSLQTAVYAVELAKGTAKTVTENKTVAEASLNYISAREALEGSENDLSYLRTYIELYTNSHIFYRNLSKGEMQ